MSSPLLNIKIAATLVIFSLLAGCLPGGSNLPIGSEELVESVGDVLPDARLVKLSTENIAQYSSSSLRIHHTSRIPAVPDWEYHIGAGDVLKIIVWGVSELTDSSGYIEGAPAPGTVVQSDGSIFFPYIGIVDVGGKTIPKIREDLTERLGTYFPDPQVEVRILEFNSQSAVVAGAVSAPARYALGATPTRLLDLLALARHDPESADLYRVVLHRGSRSYTVNLKDYLERGRDAANPLIVDGDTVFVPEQEQLEAFVLGEIERASSIDITQREVNLTQILSEAGGLTLQDADARGIFVFRRDQSGVTVFQLDVSNPSAYLLGTQFIIRAKDVVYVTTDPVSRWNRLISDLLPSVGLYQTAQDI